LTGLFVPSSLDSGQAHLEIDLFLEQVFRLGREFLIDNLLIQIHLIIVMIRWTGLAPWEIEFPFSCSLTSAFLVFCSSFRLQGPLGGVRRLRSFGFSNVT